MASYYYKYRSRSSAPVVAVTAIGTLDGGIANPNGATIIGTDLFMQSASVTDPGLVNNTTQTFSGDKTLLNKLIHESQNINVGAGTQTLTGITSSFVRINNPETPCTALNGIESGINGQVLYLSNRQGSNISILSGIGGSGDQIVTADGNDFTLRANTTIKLIYDGNSSAWNVVGQYPRSFVGDTGFGGLQGLVPEPQVGDAAKFLKGNGTWAIPTDTGITQLTSDITAGPGNGSQAATIANDAVTNAKLANMATQTIKGRTTAGTGDPEDLTATQATAVLNAMVGDSGSGGTKGLVPAPASGDAAAGKFLKSNATWVNPITLTPAWSGHFGTNSAWSRTSATLGLPAIDATSTLTEDKNNLFGTVNPHNDGTPGNNYPGIVVNPAIGTYFIIATILGAGATLAALQEYGLTADNGSTFIDVKGFRNPVANHSTTITLQGMLTISGSTTIDIFMAASSGANSIDTEFDAEFPIKWSLWRIY